MSNVAYIAGPMRGIPYYNFPAFDAAAYALTEAGWKVINPAELDRRNGFDAMKLPETHDWNAIPPNFDFAACVKRDIEGLMEADTVFLLKGWENSKGALAEKAMAEFMGKHIVCSPELWERAEAAKPAKKYRRYRAFAPHLEDSILRDAADAPDPGMDERCLPLTDRNGCPCEFTKKTMEHADRLTDKWVNRLDVASSPDSPRSSILPTDAKARKTYPLYRGLLKYFPDALAVVAHVSYVGNEQHHPGTELHWDKSKSSDELDALMRHITEEEWGQVAWRALANLQRMIDAGWRPKE